MGVQPAFGGAARSGVPAWPAAAVSLLLVAVIHHRAAAALWDTWRTNDTYSHGPLVPLVSAALVWRERRRLRAAPVVPDGRGVWPVALGAAMHAAGLRADLFALQGWSLIPMLYGLSWVFLGSQATRILAFPIGYLGFMLTFPPLLVNQLSFALKEVAVAFSTRAAEALGAVFQRQGMTLYLASGELRIEHPCSGLRSLVALLATGVLLAHLARGAWWARLALAALAVPAAILANAVRLTAIVLVAHYDGVGRATGAFHDLSGYLVYALALALLLLARHAIVPGARADRAP